MKEDGEVESCKVTDSDCVSCEDITGACLSCGTGSVENGKCKYLEKPVISEISSRMPAPPLEGSQKTAVQSSKVVLAVTTVVLMPVNISGGLGAIKTMQTINFIGFIDVQKPQNSESFLTMFNSNFLSVIPNPFSKADHDNTPQTAAKENSDSSP